VIDSGIIDTPKEADLIIKKVSGIINGLSPKSKSITSLGIASAGRCDEKTGIIRYATKHIENWTGMPIGKRIHESTGILPLVNNDANLAAYGQWKRSKESSLVLLTIGTGIGAGIIIDGKIVQGAFGGAAEVGHVIVPGNNEHCTCSKCGCIETIASAKVLKEKLDSQPQEETKMMQEFTSNIA